MLFAALRTGRNSVNATKLFRFNPLKSHLTLSKEHNRISLHVHPHPPSPTTTTPTFGGLLLSQLARPSLFTFGFSATVFGAAYVINLEKKSNFPIFNFKPFWGAASCPSGSCAKCGCHSDDASKVVYPIIGLNALVLAAWKLVPESPVMRRWFLHYPRSPLILPMLFSTFSHMGILHAVLNMNALNSFSKNLVYAQGIEQFGAVYLAGGAFASLAGMTAKLMRNRITPTLGASGAVFAVIGASVFHFPDNEMKIVFLPWFSFRSAEMLVGLIAVDVAGLVLGWRRFDHAAHLGEVLFGLAYANYGEKIWWDPVMSETYIDLKWDIFQDYLVKRDDLSGEDVSPRDPSVTKQLPVVEDMSIAEEELVGSSS